MAQWVNCLRNNIFVNLPPFLLLWSPTPSATGLMAGRQAGGRRNAGDF